MAYCKLYWFFPFWCFIYLFCLAITIYHLINLLFAMIWAGLRSRCQVPRFHVSGARFKVAGPSFQVPGLRCQGSGARCQVPGCMCHTPGVRCQGSDSQEPSGIRPDIKMLKSFTLEIFYVLTGIKNLFYISTVITNLQTHSSPC